MKKLVKLVLILMIAYPLTGIAVSSCAGESDCSTAGRAMLLCTVNKIVDNIAVKDTLESLTITAIYTDSIILNDEKDVKEVYLPLRYASDSTTLIFHYDLSTTDTLIFLHTNTPKFISMDCGYEISQDITKLVYTRHNLDSVRVTNTSTNNNGTKNIELFFRDN